MRIIEITEARKNPELNPKTSINDIIITATDKVTSEISGVKNLFVSFTEIDKLGINPRSSYATPLGIYAYPAEYVAKLATGGLEMDRTVPFAGGQPFVNLFSVHGEIINLTTMTDIAANRWYKKMAVYWSTISGKSWKESVDFVDSLVQSASDFSNFKSYPGGQFWYVTFKLALGLESKLMIRHPVAWNKLFRELRIDGAIDTGVGIIHTSEPTQAVFFSINSIVRVQRVNNKYSPDAVNRRKELGNTAIELLDSNTTTARKVRIITQQAELINKLKPGAERLEIVTTIPFTLRYLKNPTIAEQEAAILSDVDLLFDVDDIQKIDESVIIKAIAIMPMGSIGYSLRMLKKVLDAHNMWTPGVQKAAIAKAPDLFTPQGEFKEVR